MDPYVTALFLIPRPDPALPMRQRDTARNIILEKRKAARGCQAVEDLVLLPCLVHRLPAWPAGTAASARSGPGARGAGGPGACGAAGRAAAGARGARGIL